MPMSHWLRFLGYIGFEFTLQITFGAETVSWQWRTAVFLSGQGCWWSQGFTHCHPGLWMTSCMTLCVTHGCLIMVSAVSCRCTKRQSWSSKTGTNTSLVSFDFDTAIVGVTQERWWRPGQRRRCAIWQGNSDSSSDLCLKTAGSMSKVLLILTGSTRLESIVPNRSYFETMSW